MGDIRHPGLADDNKREEATQSRDETSGAPPGERRALAPALRAERAPHPPLASHCCGDCDYVKVKVCAPQT